MAAFIDDDMNNLHIKLLVFIGWVQNLINSLWFQTSFANIGKPSASNDGLGSSCYVTLFLTFSCVNPHLALASWCWLSVWRFAFLFLFPRLRSLSTFLFPHLRVLGWILVCVSHQFPSADWDTSLSCLSPPRVVGVAQFLRWAFLHTQRVVRNQIHRSWFRHHQIDRFRLRHGRTFSKNTLLSSLWHGALLSVSKKEMAAREHRRIHDIQQTKKIIPVITCETTFG